MEPFLNPSDLISGLHLVKSPWKEFGNTWKEATGPIICRSHGSRPIRADKPARGFLMARGATLATRHHSAFVGTLAKSGLKPNNAVHREKPAVPFVYVLLSM